MQEKKLQEYLFHRIRDGLPNDRVLADVIAEKLCISTDSAYRRIRGDTLLVLEEAAILCDEFHISLDALLKQKPNQVAFAHHAIDSNRSFEQYLNNILQVLRNIAGSKNPEIIYLTKDTPIFYHFLFRPLTEFHYFIWMKSIVQHPDFTKLKYTPGVMPDHMYRISQEIMHVYSGIPSIEIWNSECVNSTIAQIEYYREADFFECQGDVDDLYISLRATIQHIIMQAEVGAKFVPNEKIEYKPSNYQLFCNRLTLGDNTLCVVADGKKSVYINYDVLNYLVTIDHVFCEKTYDRLQNLLRRATLISQTNEKQRSRFFNIMLRKIPDRSCATRKL